MYRLKRPCWMPSAMVKSNLEPGSHIYWYRMQPSLSSYRVLFVSAANVEGMLQLLVI